MPGALARPCTAVATVGHSSLLHSPTDVSGLASRLVLRSTPSERIVTRALAPQPLHRFQTMEQMRTALEEWISKSGPVVTQSQVAGIVKNQDLSRYIL